jgi:hypothetical protein
MAFSDCLDLFNDWTGSINNFLNNIFGNMIETLKEEYKNGEITIDYLRGLLDAMRIDMTAYLYIIKKD